MISLLKTAKELLNTKDCLNPKIFNADGRMHSEVRQKIMKIAKLLIKQKVECLYGVSAVDIVIVGSAGGYMYSKTSDIDVKIFLESTNRTIKNLNHFAKYCCCERHIEGIFFSVNGLLLDISFGPINYDNGGNYSVLNDCWVTKPRKDQLFKRFTPGEIVRGYYELCARISESISCYEFNNGILNGKNIAEFDIMRRKLFAVKHSLEKDYNANIKDFLIYRLFVKRGMLNKTLDFLEEVEKDFFVYKKQKNKNSLLNPTQESQNGK